MPRAFLDETICSLREYVHGVKVELVFDLEEVTMSEWEYPKPKKVIIPKTMTGETVHHRVSQGVKHISIVILTLNQSVPVFGNCRLSTWQTGYRWSAYASQNV
jgi:hypothetical protein